jgi:hypothetical protein
MVRTKHGEKTLIASVPLIVLILLFPIPLFVRHISKNVPYVLR